GSRSSGPRDGTGRRSPSTRRSGSTRPRRPETPVRRSGRSTIDARRRGGGIPSSQRAEAGGREGRGPLELTPDSLSDPAFGRSLLRPRVRRPVAGGPSRPRVLLSAGGEREGRDRSTDRPRERATGTCVAGWAHARRTHPRGPVRSAGERRPGDGYIPNLVRPARESSMVDAYASLAAGIAIAGGLIGTGMAQSGIGAAGMGIIAEKPEKFGQVLFFFVIPETLWIIGFVLGIILLLGILS